MTALSPRTSRPRAATSWHHAYMYVLVCVVHVLMCWRVSYMCWFVSGDWGQMRFCVSVLFARAHTERSRDEASDEASDEARERRQAHTVATRIWREPESKASRRASRASCVSPPCSA